MLKSFRCLRRGGWTTAWCPWRGLLRDRLGLVLLVGRWLRQLSISWIKKITEIITWRNIYIYDMDHIQQSCPWPLVSTISQLGSRLHRTQASTLTLKNYLPGRTSLVLIRSPRDNREPTPSTSPRLGNPLFTETSPRGRPAWLPWPLCCSGGGGWYAWSWTSLFFNFA